MITQILQIILDVVIVTLLVHMNTMNNNRFDFLEAMAAMQAGAIKAHIEVREDGGFDVVADEGSTDNE